VVVGGALADSRGGEDVDGMRRAEAEMMVVAALRAAAPGGRGVRPKGGRQG
jgi:hypothetical protein